VSRSTFLVGLSYPSFLPSITASVGRRRKLSSLIGVTGSIGIGNGDGFDANTGDIFPSLIRVDRRSGDIS
jgi:hypothetical protein